MANLILPPYITGVAPYIAFEEAFKNHHTIPSKVNIDFSRLKFIEPPGVAFLANATRWFFNKGCEVTFSGTDVTLHAIRYLDDSQFFAEHLGEKLHVESSCRPTTIPIKNLTQTDAHSWLEFDFIPWLMEKSGLSKASLAEVRTCIKEIINNISDHTEFDEGCIFAQWYPNKEEIKFSIADFGCGIRSTVERILYEPSDQQAIIWACQDGTSSKSLPSNRGAGLFMLIQNIVENFKGTVTITSGRGRVAYRNNDGKIYVDPVQGVPGKGVGYCLGTSIDVVLQTQNIPHAEEEEDFEWQF